MANIRQYVGARYVFKIYENSQDPSSAEWESGVTYEPLTIVTYLNSTYASKKDVPGSVGNPAANPQYWIVTGAYNGQIAALQQQIDAINNTTIPTIEAAIQALRSELTSDVQALSDRIDAIETNDNWLANKSMIIFGDSLLTTRERSTIQTYLENKVPTLTITNYSVSGTNMTAIASSIAEHSTDIASADVVLFNGGTNDWQESNATLNYKNALISAIDYIIAANPTCRILFMTSPYSINPGMTDGIYNNAGATLEVYNSVSIATCKAYGINIIDAYHCTPCNADTYTSLMVDDVSGYYVHPSSLLCEYITDLIINESFSGDNPSYYAHDIASTYGNVQAGSFIEFDPDDGVYHGSVNLTLTSDVTATNVRLLTWKIGGTMQAFPPQNIGYRGVGINFNTGGLFTFNVVNEILTLEKMPAGVTSMATGNILTFNF